jgi:hypothetical protein
MYSTYYCSSYKYILHTPNICTVNYNKNAYEVLFYHVLYT